MVLENIARATFGSDLVKEVKGTTLPCYRPMSPDDFPIVGGTAKMPRVYQVLSVPVLCRVILQPNNKTPSLSCTSIDYLDDIYKFLLIS